LPAAERNVAIVLVLGLVLLVAALAITLSDAPPSVLAASPVVVDRELEVSSRSLSACQSGELLPRGTAAMRLSISGIYGPQLSVTASSKGKSVTAGERASGWTEEVVTVPVNPVARTYADAKICFALARGAGVARLDGQITPDSLAAREGSGQTLPGRVRIEYLGRGYSWWSLASSVAARMELGRAAGGLWIVLVAIALMVVVALLAARLALRELR
jgi:hypothetical protein